MDKHYLTPLFSPASVLVFAGQASDGATHTALYGALTAQRFNGALTHLDTQTTGTLAELADTRADLAIIALPADKMAAALEIAGRIQVIAPHPLATLRFTECRVPLSRRIGSAGEGFKIAMRTLDVFRTSVAAAALGFARRALDEALARATSRKMFGQCLADFQLTQAKLGEMAALIDAAALLTYRAAWQRDQGRRVTKEAAMARAWGAGIRLRRRRTSARCSHGRTGQPSIATLCARCAPG